MKRKKYRIEWQKYEYSGGYTGTGRVDCDALVSATYPEPDFIFKDVKYWFETMRSTKADSKFMYLLDECPRTGAIMTFNSVKLQWFIQPKEVQDAYQNWLLDKHFTSLEDIL